MASSFFPIAAPILLASIASAAFTPTAPGPGDSYNTGLNCSISWQADTGGIWKNVTIGNYSYDAYHIFWKITITA